MALAQAQPHWQNIMIYSNTVLNFFIHFNFLSCCCCSLAGCCSCGLNFFQCTTNLVITYFDGSMLSKALSSGMDSEVSKLYKQKSKSLVCCSFINTTVREQRPRSHHKGATGRVQSKKSKEKSLWDTDRCHSGWKSWFKICKDKILVMRHILISLSGVTQLL